MHICWVMLFNAINACKAFNDRKPHQKSIHSLGSGATLRRFRSRCCSCNLNLGLGGLVCCYDPVKLHTCSWWSTRLSVLLILRRRVHPLPWAITQLLIMSLTALLARSTVFVVTGDQNNTCSVQSYIAAVGSSFDVASGRWWCCGRWWR